MKSLTRGHIRDRQRAVRAGRQEQFRRPAFDHDGMPQAHIRDGLLARARGQRQHAETTDQECEGIEGIASYSMMKPIGPAGDAAMAPAVPGYRL